MSNSLMVCESNGSDYEKKIKIVEASLSTSHVTKQNLNN